MLNRSLTYLIPSLLGLLLLSSCYRKEIYEPSLFTLVELTKQDPELTLFSTAIERLNVQRLQRSDRLTLFAPTDAAMREYMQAQGYANLEAIPLPDLNALVTNHLIDGDYGPSALPLGYAQTLFESPVSGVGIPVSMFLGKLNQYVSVNGVEVGATATWAENGVLYKVKKVVPMPSAYTHILINPEFSSFRALLQRPDLDQPYVSLLEKLVNATIFVPNNAAFALFTAEQRVTNLDEVPTEKINALLKQYICMGSQIMSKDVKTITSAKTMYGSTLKLERSGTSLQLVDEKGRKASVITTDIKGTNAVLHAVNRILLPI